MATKVTAVLLAFFTFWGLLGTQTLNPNLATSDNPEKIYIVSYWDAEPPKAIDPEGQYRQEVERIAADYCLANPSIDLRMRWLDWVNAEEELAAALRDGNPPDIFADWLGLSYRDHILQLEVGNWLHGEELEPVGKRLVCYGDKLWAWPRWYWPHGIIALGVNLPARLREGDFAAWDWPSLRAWLVEEGTCLEVNDWDCGFTAQAMLSSTGCGWGRWGGQELNEIIGEIELLRREGLATNQGHYLKGQEGYPLVGVSPAFMTWLAQQEKDKELILLPVPSLGSKTYLPVSGTSLIQFRQVRYKGDDHSQAAGRVAAHLARSQGEKLSHLFLGASAWRESISPQADWWGLLLTETAHRGVPLRAIHKAGRQREQARMLLVAPFIAEFWAGTLTSAELAQELEGLQ